MPYRFGYSAEGDILVRPGVVNAILPSQWAFGSSTGMSRNSFCSSTDRRLMHSTCIGILRASPSESVASDRDRTPSLFGLASRL